MAVGANISYSHQNQLESMFFRFLGHKRKTLKGIHRRFCQKAGVPAADTAADNPNALGDICIDTTNSDVYVCTEYSADASATTWTKATP